MLTWVLDLCLLYTQQGTQQMPNKGSDPRALPLALGPTVNSLPLRSPPDLAKAQTISFPALTNFTNWLSILLWYR